MKMNLKFFGNDRQVEIETRLSEITDEIETREDVITSDEILELEKEVTALKDERKQIKEGIEKRKGLLESIAEGRTQSTTLKAFKYEERNIEEVNIADTMEYRKAFMNYVLRGKKIPMEYRSNEITNTTDVGAVIPNTVLNKIIEKLEATGMILPLITKTAYKGGVSIPVSTLKPVATWVEEGEGSDIQKKSMKKDAMIIFAYHKLRCAVAVTLEVDTMALSIFETNLINNIVEAMIKGIEKSIISGTGEGQPKGILNEEIDKGKIINIENPTYNDLIEAEAALDLAYENGAVWCMSKKTFMTYFGLLDTNGQPVGRVNYGIAGKPERSLLGRTVIVNDYITSYSNSIEGGTAFAFLFNFKDYLLNTNYSMGIKKYEDNKTDDTVTKAIMLVDGKVVDKGSLVILKKVEAPSETTKNVGGKNA